MIWVAFFVLIGGINIYVAYSFSEPTWVKFKLFGMLGLTLVFVIVQTIWLTLAMKQNETMDQESHIRLGLIFTWLSNWRGISYSTCSSTCYAVWPRDCLICFSI